MVECCRRLYVCGSEFVDTGSKERQPRKRIDRMNIHLFQCEERYITCNGMSKQLTVNMNQKTSEIQDRPSVTVRKQRRKGRRKNVPRDFSKRDKVHLLHLLGSPRRLRMLRAHETTYGLSVYAIKLIKSFNSVRYPGCNLGFQISD